MRIGISTSVIQRGQSGIAQYVFALCRALMTHQEHEYIMFVLEKDLDLFHFTGERMRLIPVSERHRPPLRNILWHQTVLPRLAKRLHLDVLHLPSYRRLIWNRPCPLVATIHDLAPFRFRGKYNWPRMFYGRAVVPQLARRLDHIMTVSETTAGDVTQFLKVPRERLTVVHNGVEHARFFPGDTRQAKSVIADRYGLNDPFFLYVARLEHPAKNHLRLIAAFDRFKAAGASNWQLALAGGDWHGAEQIHRAVQVSPHAGAIRCLGFVPDADLPDLYRAAGAFVYPSLFEGFGMPPIEAMACGCPVISSPRGSLREILGGAAIQIDPENIENIAAELDRLSASEPLRNQLREAGLARASRFDWAKTAAAAVSIYERAAAADGKRKSYSYFSRTRAPVEKVPVNTALFSGKTK